MPHIQVYLFKASFGPFITLLNEHSVAYQMKTQRSGVPVMSSEVVEILQSAAMWSALAAVVCAYLKNRRSRKIIITTKDNMVVNAEGLSEAEVERLLEQARSLTAIETGHDDNN